MRFLSLLCILSVVLLSNCTNRNGKNNQKTAVTIATLKGPSAMGMIRFIDSLNHVENACIEVEIVNEPIQVRKMMLDNKADFAVLPTTMAAITYNKGLEYKLIAIPVWGTLFLFGNDSTITCWEDLRHKKVHVMARGMTPDVLFQYLLKKNGIDPQKDITLDYSFPTHIDLANAVAAGRAELGVISEPLVSLVIQKNKQVRAVFDLNREWEKIQGSPIAQTALLVKKEIIEKNPRLVEEVLAAYEKSSLWVHENPDSAAVLIAKYGILPNARVALQAIPGSGLHFVRARNIRSQISDYLNVFYNMNPRIIGEKMPDETFYY
ncbi:MAG: ABC transporter substrate-binding protein [Bacteroidales bacterium]|nr:ABC transporter substrate-binding protein [Bacteroidales bacterium]MDD2771160.1 ABC transporter substrate-binding protein [Bacteroidales bacterium]MDD3549482.1 ABC transporter substrate-binding protein [Bacteroidales bacterium]MDD4064510.1 ABC transporter substrate-binding protein [Bacteroidales bacterium]MDD4499401.1 ABC transporter substrate-binding protein [Bacteroidales bacterium]